MAELQAKPWVVYTKTPLAGPATVLAIPQTNRVGAQQAREFMQHTIALDMER